MRKGALIVGLAAIALLALVWAQRRDMGGCDIDQAIITPDGHEFHFVGPRIVPGSPDLDWPLESGDGLPQIEHLSQEIYGMPGALYKGTIVKPRVLTVVATVHGLSYSALMDMKARMQSALRWDRGAPGEPSIYRITMNGVSRDLYVRYDGAVERRVGRPGRMVVVAIRMIAYDPMWYDPDTEEQVLDWGDNFTVRYCIGKEDGVWTPLGPPVAVAAGAGGSTDVFDSAVDPLTGNVYFGGDFRNWDNLAAPGLGADHIVRWNVTSQTWEVVGNGLNERVTRLYFGPDGSLYVGGLFTNGSGGAGDANADYLARYDRNTDTFVNVGNGPGVGVGIGVGTIGIWAIVIGHDGVLYVGGDFINWSAAGKDFLVQWDAVGGWALLGAVHPDNVVRDAVILPNGNLVVGGLFSSINGLGDANAIAEWDGANWGDLDTGMNGNVNAVAIAPDGTLYAGGFFTQAGSAPTTVNYAARWNGTSWSDLDGGMDNTVWHLEVNDAGELWAGGAFTQSGGLTLTGGVARWNGFAWTHIPVDLPGVPTVDGISFFGDNIYFGFNAAGTAYVAGDNSVVNLGNVFALPIVEIKNHGLLQSIRNETMDYDIPCDMLIQDGEIVTIDLSSGVKSCESNWRGNRLGDILPASDMATFCLESYPRAAYGGVEGANLITVFITDAGAREHNDGGNQLSGWDNVTGISQHNTDLGRLYASVVVVGGGFNRVDFYSDAARAAPDLVAHTANYNAPGAQAIVADNASGLGGTITIDAVGAGDVDIFVWYTIVTMFWSNRWWSLDAAVT